MKKFISVLLSVLVMVSMLAIGYNAVVYGDVIGNENIVDDFDDPSEPSTDPSEPSTDPSEPSTEPSEPSTEPSQPSTEPSTVPSTEPSTEATTQADADNTTTESTTATTNTDTSTKSPSTGVTGSALIACGIASAAALITVKKKASEQE